MKIRLINWINLAVALIDFGVSIWCFTRSLIAVPIFCLVAGAWNLFVFFHAVSVWWERSPKVAEKFVFTCSNCEHQSIPAFWAWFFVPHLGSRRYLKCEKCGKHTWMRRK